MATIILEHETNGYWNLIKDAGNEVKLALIKRLSDAVMPAVSLELPELLNSTG